MDEETAYRAMMALVNKAGLRAEMQRTIEGDWDVVMSQPGMPRRVFHTRSEIKAYYLELRRTGKLIA